MGEAIVQITFHFLVSPALGFGSISYGVFLLFFPSLVQIQSQDLCMYALMSYISRTKHFSTLYMYIYKSESSGRLGIGSGWKTEPSMSGIRKKRSNSERISQPTPIRLTWNWRNSSKRSEGNENRKAQASLAVHLRRSRIRFRRSVQLSVSALIKEFCAEVNESRERRETR